MVALLFRGLLYSVILPAVRLDEGTGSNPGNRSVSATAVSYFGTIFHSPTEVAFSVSKVCIKIGARYCRLLIVFKDFLRVPSRLALGGYFFFNYRVFLNFLPPWTHSPRKTPPNHGSSKHSP